MGLTLDLDMIHSINLFAKITHVHTKSCFRYNNWLIFVVPPQLLAKAIGEKGENIRQISRMIKTKVKVIPEASMEPFVKAIIYPLKFKKISLEDGNVVILAGQNSKAALIGRGKVRAEELEKILKAYFGAKGLKIL